MHIHDIIKKNDNKLYYIFIINSYFTRINILYFIKLISHAIFNLPQTQFDYVNFQLINTHLRWFNDKNIRESNKMIRLLDYFSFVRCTLFIHCFKFSIRISQSSNFSQKSGNNRLKYSLELRKDASFAGALYLLHLFPPNTVSLYW